MFKHHKLRIIFSITVYCIFMMPCMLVANELSLTPEELDWIREHPEIRVVANHGPEPLSMVRRMTGMQPPPPMPKGGMPPPPPVKPGLPPPKPGDTGLPLIPIGPTEQDDFKGLAADYLKEIAAVTGLKITTTHASPNSFIAMKEALDSGEVDIMPTVMLDRSADMFMVTDPYVSIPVVVIMQEGSPYLEDPNTLAKKRVAGVLSVPEKIREAGLDINVIHTNPKDGLMGVATGKYDAFIAELSIVTFILDFQPISNIKIVGEIGRPSDFGMGVSPHAPELVSILNKAIKAIPKERKDAIWKKWFPITYEKSIVSSGWLVMLALVSLLALVLGGFGFVYYRKRIIRIRAGLAALEPHLLCVYTDSNVTITEVTKAMCELTGFNAEELIGKPLSILGSPKGESTSMDRLFSKVDSGDSWKGEARLLKKDGTSVWADVVVSPSRRKSEDQEGYTVIYQDASQRKHFEKLATKDELTGLFNKRHFNDIGPMQLAAAKEEGKYFALLLMDVDNFKKYNDNYGHPAGDVVLSSIGKTLRTALKRDNDVSFRLGGEEFGTVTMLSSQDDAKEMAAMLLEAIRSLDIEHAHNPPGIVTMSMGIRIAAPGENFPLEQLYEDADKALYEAKESGRNKFVIHS